MAGGTLNIVLANKNGFVIAADSRMSSRNLFDCNGVPQHYCDDSRKTFRTGERSALAIAGFAAGGIPDTRLRFQVASVLLRRFGSTGRPGDAGSVGAVSGWLQGALSQALTAIAATGAPEDLRSFVFSAIVAGFDEQNVPVIRRLLFLPVQQAVGPVVVPAYTVREEVIRAEHFMHVTAGIEDVSRKIFSSAETSRACPDYYATDSQPILAYYRASAADLDTLDVNDLEPLARSILDETKRSDWRVGGDDQVGLFSVNAQPQWHVNTSLPVRKQLLPRLTLRIGGLYSPRDPRGVGVGMSYFEDFQQPLDEPVAQVFLGARFNNVGIVLDGNYFILNSFQSPTFKYHGGFFYFDPRQALNDCTLEETPHASVPPDSPLRRCKLALHPTVIDGEADVGRKSKVTVTGCVTHAPDGSLRLTTGGKCGKTASVLGPIESGR